MSKLTHIFFDLHGTLIDTTVMGACYSAAYGRIMADRYGLDPMQWRDANRLIMADWDSYYADLNLDGENGIDDMWEGLYRTTRAMFRVVGQPEPPHEELRWLSRWIPGEVPRACDAFYADAKPMIRRLYDAGYTLGITSHALVAQAAATLEGGGMREFFTGPIIGPDNAEQYRKDYLFYAFALRQAGADASVCMAVDDRSDALDEAKSMGMQTFNVRRSGTHAEGLAGLADVMSRLRGSE